MLVYPVSRIEACLHDSAKQRCYRVCGNNAVGPRGPLIATFLGTIRRSTPFALVVRAGNATVRVQKVPSFTPLPFTVMGWKVGDLRAVAVQLKDRGVSLKHFDGLTQDEFGIWDSPSGAKVGWFKDPDGNVLSLTQFA